MKKHVSARRTSRRLGYACAAVLLLVAAVSASLFHAVSADQVTSRSIEMSDSNASSTGVTYNVTFTTNAAGYTIQGIVVDFCDNTPIINDTTCTPPTGFDVGGATPSVTTGGAIGSSGWTATGANVFNTTEYRTLILTNATGVALGSSATVNFTINNATNPSTDNHPFYARILTYTSASAASAYSPSAPGSYTDYGGAAMSTARAINVSAKVMETLSFCVYHTTCGDDPSIVLGHGTNTILDSTQVDTATDGFSIATNASNGAAVRMKGNTLVSGSNTIPAANSGSSSSGAPLSNSTGGYGMAVSSPGAMTADQPYIGDGSAGGNYGLDTTSGTSVTSLYGSQIAHSTSTINASASTLTFGAIAANTTPAGIYTASEQLIATGTF